MEGNCSPESSPPHPPPPWSDASFLLAENGKDILHPLANTATDNCKAWTDEKHNLYLHQMEMAFVKQLYQSKFLLAKSSKQCQRNLNLSRKELMSNAPEQFGALNTSWGPKVNCVMGDPLSGSTSADSKIPLTSNRTNNFKHMGKHHPPASAETPELLKLCSTMEHGKRTVSLGLARSPQRFSCCKSLYVDSFGSGKEGMGQNFIDEDNQRTSDFESQPKRLKITLADISSEDQIVPSRKYLAADCSVVKTFALSEVANN